VPSAFLVNAMVLFAGVAAFVIAGCAGSLISRVQPWRFRLLLLPLGFVIGGGVGISAESHLLRWWNDGMSPHTFWAGILQTIVLLVTGSAGALAGIGLGFSLDLHLPAPVTQRQGLARYWERTPGVRGPVIDDGTEKVVPISKGRRQPGVVPRIRARSGKE
jgi:hypothetical protein